MVAWSAALLCLAFLPLVAASDPGSGGEQCFAGDTHPDVTSHVTWTTSASSTTVRVTFSKNFVDNTYGANSVGWGSHGHQFKNLVGSDHVILAMYNGDGVDVMEPKIDYISQDSTAPSGYRTLGVRGGDGGMPVGNADDVLSVETSESKNFNTYGYVLTQDSPATDEHYTPNAAYPDWIFDVWYEVTVKSSAFGPSGFDHANMTFVHASPSKTGSNSEVVSPAPCPPPPTPSPCPEGQMRDTQTGQCGPTPCPEGQMRDTQTGQCGPTPCPEGQMRDTQTGQCGPTPCPEGQMRDAVTGNCGPPPTSTPAPVPVFPTTTSLVLGSLGAFGAAMIVMRRKAQK